MIPLLEANIAANGFHRREGVVSRTLSWGDDDHIEAVAALGPFDLVVGSDLLYNPASTMLLVDTLEALSTPGRTEVRAASSHLLPSTIHARQGAQHAH